MSVNRAHANNGVLIHTGETILLFSDNATLEFSQNDAPIFKGSKTGRIYLTTHRIIFNNKNMAKDNLKSLSAPFVFLSEIKIEQPAFGANCIKGKVSAEPDGGFVGLVGIKITFKSGGAIEFGQAMSRAAKMAQSNVGSFAPPPPYEGAGNWYQAPPPAYSANTTSYGWLPTNFTTGPDPNTVFMSDVPPPYPGINPNPPQQGGAAYGQQPGPYPAPQGGAGYYPQTGPNYPQNYPQSGPPAYPGYPSAPGYPNGAQGFPSAYPQGGPPAYGSAYPGAQSGGMYPNIPGNSGFTPQNGGYGFNPTGYNEEKKAL